jgi:hypothetical protein
MEEGKRGEGDFRGEGEGAERRGKIRDLARTKFYSAMA